MADTVTSKVINDGPRNYTILITNRSDGTGESAVTKIDISTLVGPDGSNAPSYFAVQSIEYDVQGFTRVDLLYDATTDQPMAVLGTGQGYLDGAMCFPADPKATGYTGDIKLTTSGAVSGASYTITLRLKKHQ